MEHTAKKLHLGCADKIIPGFINVDVRDLPGVDVVADARKLDMFENGSVDLMYACHILEHFPRPKTFPTILEWNRVLKPGGVLRIAVPDWDATVEAYRRTGDYENLLNWIYGGREYGENVHYRQFSFNGLKTLLIEAAKGNRFEGNTITVTITFTNTLNHTSQTLFM